MIETADMIDSSMGLRQGLFFLRPAKQDSDGNLVRSPEKPHVLSYRAEDHEIVGFHHRDGPGALDAFCKEHADALQLCSKRRRPHQLVC